MPLSKHTVAQTPGDYQDGGPGTGGRMAARSGYTRGAEVPHVPADLALPLQATTLTISNRVSVSLLHAQ